MFSALEDQTAQIRTMEQELTLLAKSTVCWCAFFMLTPLLGNLSECGYIRRITLVSNAAP